jgi:serine/threonine-protein kinase 24/25/MST4
LDECSALWFSSVACLIKSLLTRSYSFQGNTVKNAGWDFTVGGSQSIGTVRALKPPQARERRQEVSPNRISQRTTRPSGNQWSSATGSTISEASEGGFVRRHPFQNDHEDGFHEEDDSSLSGSGTVVIRTPRSSQSSSVFREPSSGV